MITLRRRSFAVIGLVWCSWLAAASYRAISELFGWRPEIFGPEIPYLLMVPGTKTDVMSSVSYLVWVLFLGVGCCIPTEVAKLTARTLQRPVTAYVVLVGFQAILCGDVLRTYAYDWWRYLLSLAHVRSIGPLTWMETSVARVPWVSGISAVCVTMFLCYLTYCRPTPERTASAEFRP